MRRKEKEIEDRGLIDQIIRDSSVCRLGLCKNNVPYVVPVCFGYDGTSIYFHTANAGTKIEYILSNPYVCFEFEHEVTVIRDETKACKWTIGYYSVIGWGMTTELEDEQQHVFALNQIMQHYSGQEWDFDRRLLQATRTWVIAIEKVTGKQSRKTQT